jgi:hypothetical protein
MEEMEYYACMLYACFVPLNNIICNVEAPTAKGSGRMHYFSAKDTKRVNLQLLDF